MGGRGWQGWRMGWGLHLVVARHGSAVDEVVQDVAWLHAKPLGDGANLFCEGKCSRRMVSSGWTR